MRLHLVYTPAHEVLLREHFLPSLPRGYDVREERIDLKGAGDFLSPEFLECIRRKVDLILESLHGGGAVLWSDVDILFFDAPASTLEELLEKSGCDILFQREARRSGDVNTGFFVARCGGESLRFFEKVRLRLRRERGENEQMAVNALLRESPDITHGALPWSFYARTHGWPPPRRLAIYHANYTKGEDGIGQKIAQFREIRRIRQFGLPAYLWSILRRIPGKVAGGGRSDSP